MKMYSATLKFSNGQVIPVKVELIEVDQDGMAYVRLPSGLVGVQRFADLKEVTQ